jgi:hypothetical protein
MKQPRYLVYGLQKTFAKDINGILTSDLVMIYLAPHPVSRRSTATTLVLRDDLVLRDNHGLDSEDKDSYYSTTIDEMTPSNRDNASKIMLLTLGSLPLATE